MTPFPAPSAVDRALGGLAFAAWRALGLLLLPLLMLIPDGRRRIWGLPAPTPGRAWVHGASAGEQRAAAALAPALPEGAWRTSSSWRTPTPGALPAPLDLPFAVSAWLDRARPSRLILVEAELWPGWILGCRARGVPVAVVNAREGRGLGRWRRLGPLGRFLLHEVVWISADVLDLKQAAAPARPASWMPAPGLVAGPTRPGEEAALLAAWRALGPPPLWLVLAPRRPERGPEVVEIARAAGFSPVCRSKMGPGQALDPGAPGVLVLDTLGELDGLWPAARAAFVGGTYDPDAGGHSPAAAAGAGLPVVGGPERRSNAAAWAAAAAAGQVVDAPHLDALAEALARALALGPRPAPAAPAAADLLPRLPAPCPPPERPRWPVLAPLAPLVAGAAARRRSWAGPVERVGAPVVSVGALTAGGAGKTPVVAFLAEQLPGAWVVARGYGRALSGPALRVGRPGEAPSAPLGDELELLRRRGVPVVSCPDRVAGARAAVEAGARIVLLDDAFGHRRLHRDVDLVCVDTRWPTGGGPLPAGLGREPWSALERATHLWLLHGLPVERPLPPRPTARARLVPAGWLRFGERLPLDALRGPVHAACGIARPEAFFTELVDLGLPIQGWTVRADHAPLGPLPPGAVVTEKDAARLPPGADVWALQLRLEVDEVGQALVGALRAHIGGGPP